MARQMTILSSMLLACLLTSSSRAARGCPFCSVTTATFNEEITSMDAVVYARLVKLPPSVKAADRTDPTKEVPKATFEITEVIKGSENLEIGQQVQTIYFGNGKIGSVFLVMGVDPPKLMWSTPLQLSEAAQVYIKQVVKLPRDPTKRLDFFQGFLENDDEMLAADAYDEFASAPYTAVKNLRDNMDHAQLTSWIRNPDVPASRRRLYLTMLGVCGTDADIPMLETMMKSKDRRLRAGLDALVACYLTLKGEAGMPLVESLFIKNKKSEYADTYAAIMALRFHGTESDIVSRERILKSMRHMLDRPELADLVIPDLARWEDWTQVERLVKLFKDADEKTSWVRVPVINYLRQCPLPLAKQRIKELEKVDPAAVKRANTFFPFGPADGSPGKTEAVSPKTSYNGQEDEDLFVAARPAPRRATGNAGRVATRASRSATSAANQNDTNLQIPVNSSLALLVPWLVAGGLFLMQWLILIGPSHRD